MKIHQYFLFLLLTISLEIFGAEAPFAKIIFSKGLSTYQDKNLSAGDELFSSGIISTKENSAGIHWSKRDKLPSRGQ